MKFLLKSLGSNGNYQLGLEDDEDHDVWSEGIAFESKPKLSCGGNHTVLLSGDKVYLCGENISGQCGFDVVKDHIIQFQEVPMECTGCTLLSTGWAFTILCNDNEVWSCGSGLNGELGLGEKIKMSSLEKVIQFDHEIVKLSSSLDHSLVQLANGDVYGWGNNKKQQLFKHDSEKKNKIIWKPTKLDLNGVVDFALGRDFTLIQFEDKSFAYYGKDKFNIESQLLQLSKLNVLEFKAMWSSVHFLIQGPDNEKKIISIGNNSHGQLFPETKCQFDNYAIGSEHGLVINENKLYSWGWGEHGNCGQHSNGDSRLNRVTYDYLNEIYNTQDEDQIIDAYCGCATSWLVIRHK